MDKLPTKTTKNKFLKLLPKTATINFQNPPFSPGRDNHNNINNNYNTTHNFFRPKSHLGNHQKTYSGPIVSIIPSEARTRPRSKKNNGTTLDSDDDDDTPEPTSPKVSCIGQIKHHKHKHKDKNKNKNSFKKGNPSTSGNNADDNKPTKQFKSKSFSHKDGDKKSPRNSFKRMFGMGKLGKRSSDDIGVGVGVGVPVSSSSNNVDDDTQSGGSSGMAGKAPTLGQMKRFSGSRRRDCYGSFDWTAQIAPEEVEEDEEEEKEEMIVPFSAPMVLGGGDEVDLKPRKEVNLWKRRTMAPPVPLQLHQQQQHHKRS